MNHAQHAVVVVAIGFAFGTGCQMCSGVGDLQVFGPSGGSISSSTGLTSTSGAGGGGFGGFADGGGGNNSASSGVGSGGEGGAGGCTPGTSDCLGNTPRSCDAMGNWVPMAPCDQGTPICVDGVCIARKSCEAGGLGAGNSCGGSQGMDFCCSDTLIPGGTFNRCNDSLYSATLSPFYLDKYEVTVGRFRAFLEAGQGVASSAPMSGIGTAKNIPDSGWDSAWNLALEADTNALKAALTSCDSIATWKEDGSQDALPISCVTWYEAFLFCAWDGGRLPTEAEWNFAAAGGILQRDYPWGGNNPDLNKAVYDCSSDLSLPGMCAITDILPVGSKPGGVSKFGNLDMAGSVAEFALDWLNAWVVPSLKNCQDCADLTPTSSRSVRGGGWDTEPAFISTVFRDGLAPASRSRYIGFRCARDE